MDTLSISSLGGTVRSRVSRSIEPWCCGCKQKLRNSVNRRNRSGRNVVGASWSRNRADADVDIRIIGNTVVWAEDTQREAADTTVGFLHLRNPIASTWDRVMNAAVGQPIVPGCTTPLRKHLCRLVQRSRQISFKSTALGYRQGDVVALLQRAEPP